MVCLSVASIRTADSESRDSNWRRCCGGIQDGCDVGDGRFECIIGGEAIGHVISGGGSGAREVGRVAAEGAVPMGELLRELFLLIELLRELFLLIELLRELFLSVSC